MARENYSYKKYQKELARKKKREEKIQNKLNKNMQAKAPHALSDGMAVTHDVDLTVASNEADAVVSN